jgi:membrane associated rhomboid family serine protease
MFGGFQFFPPVVKGLLLTNGAVFILVSFFGAFRFDGQSLRGVLTYTFGLMPLSNGFMPWQLITYQFMHADFWHILYNMVFGLWMFGMEVEHVWGSRKFLIFYLSCGVVAGIAQLLLAPIFEPATLLGPTIGASGAVFGVLVAFALMFPDRYIFAYFLIPIKVKYFVMFLIVIGVMSVGEGSSVANLAHLGGALAGYIYMQIDAKRIPLVDLFRRRKTDSSTPHSWGRPSDSNEEAKVYDIRDGRSMEHQIPDAQKTIDDILDKISKNGYQSLSEEEKKILFEESKKLN